MLKREFEEVSEPPNEEDVLYLSEVVDDDAERVFLHVGRLDPIRRLQDLTAQGQWLNSVIRVDY